MPTGTQTACPYKGVTSHYWSVRTGGQVRDGHRDLAWAYEMLHVYADLVAAGGATEQRYPGIAAHLRACGPCDEDFEALLAAVCDNAG